jgi:hypothetical protein
VVISFDNLSHEWAMKFVEHRVADRRIPVPLGFCDLGGGCPSCLADYIANNGINKYDNCAETRLDKLNNTWGENGLVIGISARHRFIRRNSVRAVRVGSERRRAPEARH